MRNPITAFFGAISDFILHHTVFRYGPSTVEMFGLEEDHPIDGHIVVYNGRTNRRQVYGYFFEDRHFRHQSLQLRTAKVFNICYGMDQIRPLMVIEKDHATTMYGPISSAFLKEGMSKDATLKALFDSLHGVSHA